MQSDPDTKEPIIRILSEIKKLDDIHYMEFLDYKIGKKYPNDSSMEQSKDFRVSKNDTIE